MIDLKFYLKNSYLEILSIFILILIVLPGMIYYNQNNFTYSINTSSVSWSPDRTKVAFIKYNNNNNELGQIMVWSKNQKSFESIHYITTTYNNQCANYEFATCLQLDNLFGTFSFTFSPNNKLLVLCSINYLNSNGNGYDLTFVIYNLTSMAIIGTNNFNGGNAVPSVNWINDSFWYASNKGLVNLLNNNSLSIYGSLHPNNSPIISPDGEKVAYSVSKTVTNKSTNISKTTFYLIVKNFQTNSLLANISSHNFMHPWNWNNNNSELIYSEYTNSIPVNYSIYNINTKKTTYTFNLTQSEGFYSITPDFKYLTIVDRTEHNTYSKNGQISTTQQNNYIRFDLDKNTNRTFQNTYYANPEVSLVYTGSDRVFKISSLPNLGTYFTYKFDKVHKNYLGFELTTLVLGTIAIVLITKNRKSVIQFFKKHLTSDDEDNN